MLSFLRQRISAAHLGNERMSTVAQERRRLFRPISEESLSQGLVCHTKAIIIVIGLRLSTLPCCGTGPTNLSEMRTTALSPIYVELDCAALSLSCLQLLSKKTMSFTVAITVLAVYIPFTKAVVVR